MFPTIVAAVEAMALGSEEAAAVRSNDTLRGPYAALREWRSGLLNRT